MAARGLKFSPASHRYWLDGKPVPGVTTILGGAVPKPALTKWASKSVAEYVADNRSTIERLYDMGRLPMVEALKNVPWQARDEAANRGTEVHRYAEQIIQGEEADVPEELVGHVESCIAFMEDWDVRPVLVEFPVGSREHWYAGTGDLVGDHNRGPRAIFDYKTSRSGIYFETAFQLVGYAFAEFYGLGGDEKPMADLGIEASYGVHIRADSYNVVPLEFGPAVFEEFVALIRSRGVIKRAAGDWRTPGSGYVGFSIQTQEVSA